MKWHKSLVFKLILCCIVLTLCLIGSIFGVLYRYQQSILAEMEQKSSEILRGLQVQLTEYETEDVPKDILGSSLSDLKSLHGVDAIIVYDSQRNLVTSIQSDQMPLLEFGAANTQVVDIQPEGGRKTTMYFQTLPLMVASKPVGYVSIALAISPQTHLVKALQSKVLVALVLLFLGTIAALCYFIFQLLKPLRAMATTCQEISEGNLREIDIKPNASEVLTLEVKFNEMVEALRTKAKMEQMLARTQRLSALGNLAAGVAHEIGNPLNGIKLTISHLKDLFLQRELDEASFSKYADTIIKEVNRLDGIVKDFLTLARERELSLRPYRIDKLLKETVHLVEKDAQNRGLSIKASIPTYSTDTMLDPQLMKSALLNILINAMEASGAPGTINVNMAETNGQVFISISDRGQGIPLDVMDRVFDPYFSTKPSGTGLGLSLTKTIIEKHGGEIFLESREERGTTVNVSIPTRRQ
jgi:signal transduction histidine kinase